jgi:carboxylesterase type B
MISDILVGMAIIDLLCRRAPVPIELGNTTSFGRALNATTQGPQCVQGQPAWIAALSAIYGDAASSGASISSSEDCLILDVFAPSNAINESLPVLLWIHGGGYTIGNAANSGGPNFVSSSNGSMIFVSIQYRLGAYGFLSSDEVAEDGSPNAALLDQRAAIDWVHRHIHAFGGDPSKVRAIA